MTSLAERLDNVPEWWNHEPGDKLIGVVTEIDVYTGEYGAYPIVTVLVDDQGSTEQGGQPIPVGAERAFHAHATVAKAEIARRNLATGDRLGVAFHGVPEGKSFKRYRLIVERTHAHGADTSETADNATAETHAEAEQTDEIPY
jgi:hypothetical protein